MEWINEITDITGVSVPAFLSVTILTVLVTTVVRYVLGKKLTQEKRWTKAVLTSCALACGVLVAFIFYWAGLYKTTNHAMTLVVGLFNGTLAIAGHQYLKQIPVLDKLLKGITTVLVLVCFTSCGTWLNDTRTGLLATNAGLNTYDDLAVELWKNAATNQKAREDLGLSTCASLIVQDQVTLAWEVTTAVDHGVKKKKDITPYITMAITVLDSLEDYLEMNGYPLPAELKVVWMQLERINPGGPPWGYDEDPLEQCADVLGENIPVAGMSVPWEVLLESGTELALFLMQVITDSLQGKDVAEEALDTYLRHPLKQLMLYEASLGE